MKRFFLSISILLALASTGYSQEDYTTTITFPAGYQVGDYIEFLRVNPTSAGASGNYEISLAYTRINVAAAATHLASITHSNPSIWREVGRTNQNVYMNSGSYNFTVDCNTEYGNARFRIRAVNVIGIQANPLNVEIKVRSINFNSTWTALNVTGSDLSVNKFLPMTNDWSLYVGNPATTDGASLAIKAIENGNVGIGIAAPGEKLSVNGNIRAKEIKVEVANWPDYVFAGQHALPPLSDVEKFIKVNRHLPEIPSAAEAATNGINLGQMNALLLKKIEELTLYVIRQDKKLETQEQLIKVLINNRNGDKK